MEQDINLHNPIQKKIGFNVEKENSRGILVKSYISVIKQNARQGIEIRIDIMR